MAFVREISTKNLDQAYMDRMEQEGATFIWKEDSVEIWISRDDLGTFTGKKND